MFDAEAKVLLVLRQNTADKARAFAGRTTATLKLPVSLQIVLRALIEEGLKDLDHGALLENIERQARAVRRIRSLVTRRRAGQRPGLARS